VGKTASQIIRTLKHGIQGLPVIRRAGAAWHEVYGARDRLTEEPGETITLTDLFTLVYARAMLRVSDQTRERVLQIGREDFGGVSADETIRRLIDEHWQNKAIAAMRPYREEDPQGWADYLTEADALAAADAPITDEWTGGRA
jgi:hypothetical protein